LKSCLSVLLPSKNTCRAIHEELKMERGHLAMELVLPKADVDGLSFNEQKVQACFEK
jgi:hypothetical protein